MRGAMVKFCKLPLTTHGAYCKRTPNWLCYGTNNYGGIMFQGMTDMRGFSATQRSNAASSGHT